MRLKALVLVAGLISYGSLYPFQFVAPAYVSTALWQLLTDSRTWSSFSDVLGNVGLFVPLGLVAIWWAGDRATHLKGASVTLFAGLLLAFLLQVAQVWLPAREAVMSDVIWNGIGLGIGMMLGYVLQPSSAGLRQRRFELATSTAAGIVLLWLVAHLAPFVPSLDVGGLKSSLRPLILSPRFDAVTSAYVMVQVLLVGRLAWSIAGSRRALALTGILSVGVLLGRLLVIGQSLDFPTAAGIAAGLGICAAWGARSVRPMPAGVLLSLVMFAYTLQALWPFELRTTPSSFAWIPFAASLHGSMLTNVRALSAAAFMLGGSVWLIRAREWPFWPATLVLAGWSLLLELSQTMIVGRTASITEPTLALLAGLLIVHLDATHPPVVMRPSVPARASLIVLVGSITAIVLGCTALLALPGIPYNVSGMFLDDASVMALLCFALTLVWLGAGPLLLARGLSGSRHVYSLVLVGSVGVSLVSLLLLSYSVTHESLDDILGTSNVFWLVTNRDIWGEWWRQAFLAMDMPWLVTRIERVVRYTALYSPQVVLLSVALLAAGRIDRTRRGPNVWQSIGLAASAGVWLWLTRTVAFTWAATDNLTELIAPGGPFGLGGEAYLYAIVLLMAVSVALLIRASDQPSWWPAAVAGSLAALPAGWFLLELGLEQRVQKYGLVFSGVQFLLGPDRERTLSDAALFARWAAVQVAAVTVMFVGAWITHRLLDVRRKPLSAAPVDPQHDRPLADASVHEVVPAP